MVDDIFETKYQRRKGVEATPSDESDMNEDFGAFGWLRGTRDRAIMLEIRHKDGRITAKSYAWLESAEFDPSEGITLNFSGNIIRIIGRHLNKEIRPHVCLFAGILRHRVPWLCEAAGALQMESSAANVIIENISYE